MELTDTDRTAQESAPVWDRVFDHKKYMQHEGPLKVSGIKYKRICNCNCLIYSFQLVLHFWMLSHSQE